MATSLLLADDSPTIAKILLLALQSEDYAIKSVLTAEDALHELKANTPEIFLCDLTLPGKSGYEFARLIRHDSKLNKVRIVLLASAFEPVDEVEYQACGADGLIKKPFDPSELRNKLRSINEAPHKFPDGAKVTGSLSGFLVTREQTNPNLMAPPPEEHGGDTPPPFTPDVQSLMQTRSDQTGIPLGEPSGGDTDLSNLLSGNADSGDADSILAGLLGGGQEPSAPPASPPKEVLAMPMNKGPGLPAGELDLSGAFGEGDIPAAPAGSPLDVIQQERTGLTDKTFTNATVLLDTEMSDAEIVSELPLSAPPTGISATFTTPPGGTAVIDMSLMGGTKESDAPPAFKAPSAAPVEEPLSANAQALAAFFAAEIETTSSKNDIKAPAKEEKPPASPKATSAVSPQPASSKREDEFESSLSSIEWNEGPAAASLDSWSSSQPQKGAAADSPPAFKSTGKTSAGIVSAPKSPAMSAGASSSPPASAPRRSTGGSSGGGGAGVSAPLNENMLFDTGGSSFRFSEDYVNRITKSFTGAHGEEVPESHTSPMFHQKSDDAPRPAAQPAEGGGFSGGAWSEADVARIEQIVREEVQMVVREVAEKIAWEVIPELAENIIRKELDKVMKEMEPN